MAQLKVLVVDDASFVRDLVKRTIRNSFPSLTVEEAINGKKAQSLMTRVAYDLILCDWEMPEMSGLELLRWARQQDAYKKTPFVMVTSRGDRGHVMEAVQEGVTDYLGKPFSPEQMSAKIIKALGKKLRGAPSSALGGVQDAFKQSAALLTSAPVRAATKAVSGLNDSAALLTGGNAGGADTSVNVNTKTIAEVRFANSALKAVIKAISLTEVKVIARREQLFPGILDSAVIDIELDENNVARLNGYVHQLQAVDKRVDSDFVSIVIRFVDEDPQKLEHLSKFIARFK